MQQTRWIIRNVRTGLHALAIASAMGLMGAVVTGCGRDGSGAGLPSAPVGLGAESSPAATNPAPDMKDKEKKQPKAVSVPMTGVIPSNSALIGPAGGTITAGCHVLTIPAGALQTSVQITVIDKSGGVGRVEVELLPHGTQFLRMVHLESSLPAGITPETYSIFYIESDGQAGENWTHVLSRPSIERNSVEAWLTHFSSYAPGQLGSKAGWKEMTGRTGDRFGQ